MRSFAGKVLEQGRQHDVQGILTFPETGLPLVSCLMVTRGRRFPGRHAIDCFLRQSYPSRELVVLADSADCEIAAHVAGLNDPRIRIVTPPAGRHTLGELRNLSVAEARGDYVCQWDDDDLYDPDRIETQLGALLATDAAACLLQRWTLWWPARERMALSGIRLWEGSILARTRDLPPYPAGRRGEDTGMVEALAGRQRILHLEAPNLYTYIHHGANTFAGDHFFSIFNLSRERWLGDAYRQAYLRLAARLPLEDYRQNLAPGPMAAAPQPAEAPPLVSIVVRSMGRAELRLALQSLAAQDYPALEVIVVDASGGTHPPLPEIVWRPGHQVRRVGGDRPLSRPQAANLGLDSLQGACFGFLDDDDSFDPDHVSTLMAAAAATDNPVVYGLSRLIGHDGEAKGIAGLPFNRAIMAHGPLHTFPAALVKREVLGLGCRFDEAMEISEDRDFFAQIAAHADFTQVDAVTFNYHMELGTSGTGQGANRDRLRHLRFDHRLRAKWFGSNTYHSARAIHLCRLAIGAISAQGPEAATTQLRRVLQEYPSDPNALNALAGLALVHGGDLDAAEALVRQAIRVNAATGEYRLTLAAILERNGNPVAARNEAQAAWRDERVRAAAGEILCRLQAPAPPVPSAAIRRNAPSRLAPCPCGSGRRYKQCCGQLSVPSAPVPGAMDHRCRQAALLSARGDTETALKLLENLDPAQAAAPGDLLACADLCSARGRFEQAYAFLRRADELGAEPQLVDQALDRCCSRWFEPLRTASVIETLKRQHARFAARAAEAPEVGAAAEEVHLIGEFRHPDDAASLARYLSEITPLQMQPTLWTTADIDPGREGWPSLQRIDPPAKHIPRRGHFVFAGQDMDYGDWLQHSQPSRVTIAIAIAGGVPDELIRRLVQLEDIASPFVLDFSYPSTALQALIGLPGAVAQPASAPFSRNDR